MRRPCLGCGRLIESGSRCPSCALPHLYGGSWKSRSRAVRAGATACHWCGRGFTPDNPCQADHVIAGDPGSPLVPACRRCNAGRGNRAS